MTIQEARLDCAVKQKKGLHFILASVIIWAAMIVVHLTSLPPLTKNLITFCCTAPLMPLAYAISVLLHIDFQNKGNPLSMLGLLFSLNQIPYLHNAMWIYGAVPDKMLMVIAIVFGAHLMPFGWLYQSKSYLVLSAAVPVAALTVGLLCPAYVLAVMMFCIEILFSVLLIAENRQNAGKPD